MAGIDQKAGSRCRMWIDDVCARVGILTRRLPIRHKHICACGLHHKIHSAYINIYARLACLPKWSRPQSDIFGSGGMVACVCVCVFMCVCMCVCARVRACACVHIYRYIGYIGIYDLGTTSKGISESGGMMAASSSMFADCGSMARARARAYLCLQEWFQASWNLSTRKS